MRSSVVVGLFVFGCSASVACGGARAAPKNEADEMPTGSSSAKDTKDTKDDTAASADAGAGAAESKAAASPAPAAATSSLVAADTTTPSGDDPWMASHQMPPKDVLQTMRGAQAKVQACHREGMKRDPSASGEVKIRFVVTHEGVVRVWKDQDSTMTDEDLTKCVGEVIKGLKFPKQRSPGDAWGIYKINFGG